MTTRLYKGAGPGTHWHRTDPRLSGGFLCAMPSGKLPSLAIRHIAQGLSSRSGYLSFSTSYAVAREYALSGPGGTATRSNPGFVFEVDLAAIPGKLYQLIDPIAYIASSANGRYAHEHNGGPSLILEIAQGKTSFTKAKQCGGAFIAPAVSSDLIALVNAIRDAEILIINSLPSAAIIDRHDEY